MPEAARYSVVKTLRDGRQVEIRALRPADREGLLAAVGRASSKTVYCLVPAFAGVDLP